MPLNSSMEKYKESSIHEDPNGYDLKFRFLEQTKEVVSDKHLKTLFETGDRPNGVDFELLINSKVHQDDFNQAGIEIQETIQNLSDDIYTAIDNLDEELSFDLAAHTTDSVIHTTLEDKNEISKIPNLETAISNLNSIVGGVSRQHIVMSIEEMEAITDLIHADICHVINTKETYIYDLDSTTWLKVSDFDALASVDWTIIQNIPSEFNPSYHTHTIDDVDQLRETIDSLVGGDLSKYATKEELNLKADKDHIHNEYATSEHKHPNLTLGDATGDTEFVIRRNNNDFIIQENSSDIGGGNTHQLDIVKTSFGSSSIDVNKSVNAKINMTVSNELNTSILKIGGRRLTLSSTAPANPSVGDIWIQI